VIYAELIHQHLTTQGLTPLQHIWVLGVWDVVYVGSYNTMLNYQWNGHDSDDGDDTGEVFRRPQPRARFSAQGQGQFSQGPDDGSDDDDPEFTQSHKRKSSASTLPWQELARHPSHPETELHLEDLASARK
jgi:hypothetical protein